VVSADAWDGYPSERKELLSFLGDQGIKNVVVLSGDIHASFAGVVAPDFDAATLSPVACELVAAGISSNSLFSFFEAATRPPNDASRPLITVDRTAAGGAKFTENLNMLLLHGVISAGAIVQGAPVDQALALSDPAVRANMRYVDSNSQGYGYVKVTGTQITATIVTINRPIVKPTDTGPGVKRVATFTIPKTSPADVGDPIVTGTLPFPLLPL
jgi:alkaline phosphatase D